MQPDDVRDELEIPTIATTTTDSPENLPSVGTNYEDTFMQQVRSLGATRRRKAPETFHQKNVSRQNLSLLRMKTNNL